MFVGHSLNGFEVTQHFSEEGPQKSLSRLGLCGRRKSRYYDVLANFLISSDTLLFKYFSLYV